MVEISVEFGKLSGIDVGIWLGNVLCLFVLDGGRGEMGRGSVFYCAYASLFLRVCGPCL